MIGPELAQAQFLVELAEKPAGAPWARAAQLQFGKLDAHQLGVIGHDAVFGKKRDRARLGLAVFVKVDRLLPVGFLLVVDFAQVEDVALDDFISGAAFAFDDAPGTVFPAIFLSRGAVQKHNGRGLCTKKPGVGIG